MGTRIVYQVKDSEGNLIASLFSNSSHRTQFAQEVFAQAIADPKCATGPNALIEKLVTARYLTAEGNHGIDDRIFWLVPASDADGDCEKVITAVHAKRPLCWGWTVTED